MSVLEKENPSIINSITLYYLADLINAPYGPKDSLELIKIINFNINYLKFILGCDYIVIACNSASANNFIKNKYTEMINPTSDYALKNHYKKSLLFATEATVKSKIYEQSFAKHGLELDSYALPLLANLIEEGEKQDIIQDYIRLEIQKLKCNKNYSFRNYDNFILGCTHYPLVKNIFEKYLFENHREKVTLVNILDPAIPVSIKILKDIKNFTIINNNDNNKINFILTKDSKNFKEKVKEMFYKYEYIFKIESL